MLSFLWVIALGAWGETFRFKFAEGDTYRINSVVNESVYINRVLNHGADITNRITVTVSKVERGELDSAQHDCTFMTSERTTNRTFSWGREYASSFRRDALGVYDIGPQYFMPVVRNVPIFPKGDVQPGESWIAEGEEAHDLRDVFGLMEPFRVPIRVTYTYVGPVEIGGKKLHHIKAEYTLFFDTPKGVTTQGGAAGGDFPVTTMGFSRQNLYWDNEDGILPYYTEEFRIQLQLASGTVMEFRGTAEARITETQLMDRKKIVQEMNNELSRLGIKDANARETEEGITITLENIQFEADSARLLPSEKEKIGRIAALLERYPDKELLITGHTALAGTAGARQKLSEERADAVARFLVEMGVRSEYNVYTRGFGADKPVAPNDTEANRSRNRRVEITILEK
jgi:outer membrane protein OmpA-like peptidoglycan-associated protein